ncbi:MAG: hypothetical protein IT522_02435 [Burkholderiales bacterium]|nr:hypothetical protein [Burkholderiales bacterium]
MSANHTGDLAELEDAERESDLRALLVSTVDELVQRYRWGEKRLRKVISLTLADLEAHDAVQLARIRAIASELLPPKDAP